MKRLGEITACYTMRFERQSKHSAARLWQAITNPDELAAWWGMPSARVDLRPGGEYFVEFRDAKENLEAVITEVEPDRTLVYLWGRTPVEWQITDQDEGCSYIFTHHGQPPGQVTHEGGIAAGYHVGFEALETHMDGRPIDRDDDPWTELTAIYTKQIDALLTEAASG